MTDAHLAALKLVYASQQAHPLAHPLAHPQREIFLQAPLKVSAP